MNRKILISLSPELVARLDEAASVFLMCRLDIIRRSLSRDMEFVITTELPLIRQSDEHIGQAHGNWLSCTN